MPKREHEAEFYIETEPGKAIRLRVTVFEDGMPTPHEAHAMRAPTLEEALTLVMTLQRIGAPSIKRPF